MNKLTSVYFDTDKLYLVRPSIAKKNNKGVVLEQHTEDIDIAFVDDKSIYGLVNERMYEPFDYCGLHKKQLFVGVFDDDIELLVDYLFKTSIGSEPTVEMTRGLCNSKKYYEIDEIKDLHKKIIKIIQENSNKVKKLVR